MKNTLSKYLSVLLLSIPMLMYADNYDDFRISEQEYNQIEAKLSLMSENELNIKYEKKPVNRIDIKMITICVIFRLILIHSC